MGDYYPLTPHNLDNNAWIAWQFDQPETGEGLVQAFRRDQCTNESSQLKLRGLKLKTQYLIRNFDQEETHTFTGRELMEKGLFISIPDSPGAAVITYSKSIK